MMSEILTPVDKVISYKGFEASYAWSNASQCWIGFILHLESDIFFRFDAEDEAEDALENTVERLLTDCSAISSYFSGLKRGLEDGKALN